MRLLVILVLLTVAALVAAAVVALVSSVSRRPAPPGRERWAPHHESASGTTVVSVRLVDGQQAREFREIGRVRDDAEDYDIRFLELMELARHRAALLDSERASD